MEGEERGGGWMLGTHLQGPHQSVCWLRPKRARHFLGEPGSEHRHAQHEQGGGGRGGVRHQRRESVEEERGGAESQQVALVSSSRNISSKTRVCSDRPGRKSAVSSSRRATVCLHYL